MNLFSANLFAERNRVSCLYAMLKTKVFVYCFTEFICLFLFVIYKFLEIDFGSFRCHNEFVASPS